MNKWLIGLAVCITALLGCTQEREPKMCGDGFPKTISVTIAPPAGQKLGYAALATAGFHVRHDDFDKDPRYRMTIVLEATAHLVECGF